MKKHYIMRQGAFGTIRTDADGIGHPEVKIWTMQNGKRINYKE